MQTEVRPVRAEKAERRGPEAKEETAEVEAEETADMEAKAEAAPRAPQGRREYRERPGPSAFPAGREAFR